MKALIYCRVSTDNQEREGTGLQTQLEACRNYCQGKGYDVVCKLTYFELVTDSNFIDELTAAFFC
jgi:DNA invertase Pin-like site-specific DNA recombinase